MFNTAKQHPMNTAKTVAKFVVGRSVTTTVAILIKQNVTAETRLQKAQIFIGAYAMGEMVAAQARARTGQRFDKTYDLFKEAKRMAEENTETP